MKYKEYEHCNLCHRQCGINRYEAVGYCKCPAEPIVARAALHNWEEPIISGKNGSGAIFFSGCSLGCVFCQNREISDGSIGKKISENELSELMLNLEASGAHNINLVTPTHFVPSIKRAIILAKEKGLSVPIVYNTGSFDSIEALRELAGLVDIYMPDLKYYRADSAKKYSNAPEYPDVAKRVIEQAYLQTGEPVIDSNGMMRRGVIARILLLPGAVAEAKLSLKHLYETYGDKIYISLMSQYTPMPKMAPPLDRRVTREEYRQLISYAERLGVKNCFIQDIGSAKESYIPSFDLTGLETL